MKSTPFTKLAALFLFFYAAASSAAEITIAGFAFAGDYTTAATRFPYTFKIFNRIKAEGKKEDSFSYLIMQRTKSLTNPDIEFNPQENLVKLNKSDKALMSVLVLTGETVALENYGTYYKTFVNLRGNALIFDYKSQTIVRSYPVSVVLFDATDEKPTEERVSGFVNDLVRRGDEKGLISQFVNRLASAKLPKEGTKTIQIRRGEVSSEALALMPEGIRHNPAVFEAMVSDTFGSILSEKLGVPLLPSSIGHAVGGVMSLRLEDGDDYKLKVGEGDYLFDIKLNKFAKIKISENNVSAAYVYGAYMNVHFFEPTLNTDYINADFKNGESAIIPVGQLSGADFEAYQDAMRGLFMKLSGALKQPGSKWITSATQDKDIDAHLESAREILRN